MNHRHGYQLWFSAMAIPNVLQPYVGSSGIYGDFGDASEFRAGVNWIYFLKQRGLRVNVEWIDLNNSRLDIQQFRIQWGKWRHLHHRFGYEFLRKKHVLG